MIRAAFLTLLLLATPGVKNRELDLHPADGWVDTGIDVNPGDTLRINATGQLQFSNAQQPNGPEGLSRSFLDLVKVFQLNEAGRGALVGRIGSSDAARPFLIGALSQSKAAVAGRLFVAINRSSIDEATGSYHVSIARTASATPAATRRTSRHTRLAHR